MVKHSQSRLDATFAALSHPTRRGILARLTRGEASVSDLAAPYRISLPGLTKHLRVLERAKLITRHKKGRVHRCRLAAQPMKDAAEWIERYRQFWEQRFDALARFLEESEKRGEAMVASQQEPENRVQVRRIFSAPRDKVFEAWTKPEKLEKWMCRDNPQSSTRYWDFDIREGGGFHLENRMPDGTIYKQWIGYRVLKPPEKLALDWSWERFNPQGKRDEGPHESLVTVEFRELWNSTEVVLTHELLPTEELREGVRKGWNGCFDMLERCL
jgi:uncharacterized protein YndB with AHSA1/START domain/DNA-binding transcriptional ArsR family regulator